jgi:hypothetical protein
VTLSIFDDNGSDIAKTLTLWISPQVANGQLIGPSTDTIIIDEVPVAQPLVFLPSWTLETTQNTVLYCPVSIDRLPQPGTTVQVLFNTIDATPLSAVAGVDYQRVQNFTVSFTSAGPQFVNVPITIDSNSLQQSNVTFAVALSSPVNASLGVSFGTVTIINAPTSLVQFTSANYLAKDKDKNVNLTVVLSQPCPNDLTVNYSTSPGTAKPATPTSSGDYTAVSGALKFPAGLTSKTFQVPIVDDNGVEPDETFVVSLSGLAPVQWAPFQPAAFGAISRAVVTIHDTDTAVPAVTIDSTTVLESVGTAQVHAKLSRPYSIPFKFTYQTTDGSATSATDYSAIPPTTVQFDLQSTQKTINVAIKNTDPYETPESFTIGAAGATNSNYTCNLYSDLLSRDADAVGFNTCLTNLSNGLSLNAIAQSFVGSAEFVTGVVSQAYQRLLFRSADGGGSAYWTRQVVMVNHITLETLLGKLAGSDEYFTSRAGYNSTFIQLIYYDILGRAADTAGYNNWLSQLNNGTKTREQIATALATSTEYFDNYVNAMYQRYLHRAADATGYNYWTNQLINGLSRSETFIAGLVGSVEYFHNLNLQSSTGTVTITDNPLITQPPDQRNFEFPNQFAGRAGDELVRRHLRHHRGQRGRGPEQRAVHGLRERYRPAEQLDHDGAVQLDRIGRERPAVARLPRSGHAGHLRLPNGPGRHRDGRDGQCRWAGKRLFQ